MFLQQIRWENRLKDDIGNTCLASVDGVDFRILGKKLHDGQPDKRYYSFKFKAPGLRYMVVLPIRSSDIVFLAGPYLPGLYNDLQIFRMSGVKDEMEQTEKMEADDGYLGEHPAFCMVPSGEETRQDQQKLRGRVRMQHEHVNKRMKQFGCLLNCFRHGVEKHSYCFRAVAVITKLAMQAGEETIDVGEYDDRLSNTEILGRFGV